jgi:hypothetical protein
MDDTGTGHTVESTVLWLYQQWYATRVFPSGPQRAIVKLESASESTCIGIT